MPIEILMPALSPTMEEGKLAKWTVKEGDEIAAGDVIAEIETDKATMEVEAVDEGKIGKILIEEGTDGLARTVRFGRHPALLGRTVEDGKIELLVAGVKCREQVEDGVEHEIGAGVRLVDLVDHDDRLQAARQGLGEHELGLRHRSFGGVDQQDGAVDHGQDALHFTAEIGMTGRVDDIDARVFPFQRRDLGEDGDAALAFLVVGVEHPVDWRLVRGEHAGGGQHRIHECRLAVVDVGNQRHVPEGGGRHAAASVSCPGR